MLRMHRHLRERQLDCRRSARLSLSIARPGPERHGALQVRQREGRVAVAAVLRAEQRKERLILRDRQQLAIAKGPSRRDVGTSKKPYLPDKLIFFYHM